MKICVAQTRPAPGNIAANIVSHCRLIRKAAASGTDVIVFPELSLTGYEPTLAKELATDQSDPRLNEFELQSKKHDMVIAVGLPTRATSGIQISLVVFQPDGRRWTYSKQFLHTDEDRFFVAGSEAGIIEFRDTRIALAICYEASREEHSEQAARLGAEVYVASVADSKEGAERAFQYLPAAAVRHSMPVLMANCVGPCDNFVGVGQSSVWDSAGDLISRLDSANEDILIYDTAKKLVI